MKIHGHGHSGGPGGPDGVPPGHDIDKPGDGNDRKSFEEIMEEQQAEVIQEQIEREQEEERQRQIEEQYRQKQLLRQRDAQKGEEVIQNIDEDQQEDVALTEKDETAYQKKALSNNLEAPRFSVKQQKVGNTQITSEVVDHSGGKKKGQLLKSVQTSPIQNQFVPKGKGMNDPKFSKIDSGASTGNQSTGEQTLAKKGTQGEGEFDQLLSAENPEQTGKPDQPEHLALFNRTQQPPNLTQTDSLKTQGGLASQGSQGNQESKGSQGRSLGTQGNQGTQGSQGQTQDVGQKGLSSLSQHPEHPEHPLGGPPGLQKKGGEEGPVPGQLEDIHVKKPGKGSESGGSDKQSDSQNPSAQNLPLSAYFPQDAKVANVQQVAPAGEVQIPEIEKIVDRIMTGINATGNPEVKVDLHLPELGQLNVNITRGDAGALTIQLNAETEQFGQRLGENMQALYTALTQKALSISNIQIMIQNQPMPLSELIETYRPNAESRVFRKDSTSRTTRDGDKKSNQPSTPKGVKGV